MANVPKVFISSTVRDLSEYRQAAAEAVRLREWVPLLLNEYPDVGGKGPPLEECLKKVAEADVVIVIVGHCCGWVPDDGEKSITRLECERAFEEPGKEVLPFLSPPLKEWPVDKTRALPADGGRRGDA